MGLDTTHNAWHGSYSIFGKFRNQVAFLIGIPLDLMEGFYDGKLKPSQMLDYEFPSAFDHEIKNMPPKEALAELPLSWEPYVGHPLYPFLNHSDCDGEIEWEDCLNIAEGLEDLVPRLTEIQESLLGGWADRAAQFAEGCRLAYILKENIEFH